MPTTQSKIPQKTLKAAAKLLQGAHDYIEEFGFDINTFDGRRLGARGGHGAPMCYIGTVRHLAGIDPTPGGKAAADGDGPELVLALQAMDKVAKRRLKPDERHNTEEQFRGDGEHAVMYEGATQDPSFWTIGRFVESLGFEIEERAAERFSHVEDWEEQITKRRQYERNYALKLLRQALTDLYR